MSRWLGLEPEAALALRHSRLELYGTTLEWLMTDHGFTEVEDYFAEVHPAWEADGLGPDPALAALLDGIELPKAIFTNAPREHAERILRRLGVEDRFEAIYDIRWNQFKGKPRVEAARRVCAACGVEPREAAFVDDIPRYVEGFIEAGGRGILLDESGRHAGSGLPTIATLAGLPSLLEAWGRD
jgi:putative hydrolase of the HAD superfamily